MSTASSSARSSLVEAAYSNFPTSVAILDADGEIVDVNLAWRTFGEANGAPAGVDSVGDNYLAACDAARATDEDAGAVGNGLRDLLLGERDVFSYEYECSSPEEVRWFLLQAVRFSFEDEPYVLVAHLDITDRKLGELEISKVNERLSALASLLSEEMSTAASLSVGRLSLLEGEIESEHLPPLRTSLKSLQDNVTELLTIVRGEILPATDEIDLEALANDVWERTASIDQTLTVEGTGTIEADPERLSRLLNHLYRVSILRSAADGGVTLRPTDHGFLVEHDWPAATPETDPMAAVGDGAWLDSDLAIAQLLAAAHGWMLEAALDGTSVSYRVVGVEMRP